MFQKKLKNDLEDEFGEALQNPESLAPRSRQNKRLMLINEAQIETLKNGNWRNDKQKNSQNSNQNLQENRNWQNNNSNLNNPNPSTSLQVTNSENLKSYSEDWQIGRLKNPRNFNEKNQVNLDQNSENPKKSSKFRNQNTEREYGFDDGFGDSLEGWNNQRNAQQNNQTKNQFESEKKFTSFENSQRPEAKNNQDNFEKSIKKNKFGQFWTILLVLTLIVGFSFGSFWILQTEKVKNEKIATECSELILELDKNLGLNCQKIGNPVFGIWNNQNLGKNLAENKAKIETAKTTLNGEIDTLKNEINAKIVKIETGKLATSEQILEFKKTEKTENLGNLENNSVKANFLKNLQIKMDQKVKITKLDRILTVNLDEKTKKLEGLINKNLDLSEIGIENYQNYLKNLQTNPNLTIQNNPNLDFGENSSPINPNKIDLVAQTDELEGKTRELQTKIDEFIAKNPDKNKRRLLKLYKNLTGAQFKEIYNNFVYQKVGEKAKEIVILEDKVADDYIAKLAEKRGYLRRVQADESKLEEIDGQKLQTEAKKAFEELKTEVKKENLDMVMVSGYRAVKEQQGIFVDRLGNLATISSIKTGKSDVVLDKLLETTSVPGYSRHHTGYTFDLGCGSTELTIFKDTKCYEWLSKDNYLNAKRFGLIPSYPEGGGVQGPDPEAWEYVWVGSDILQNKK